MNWFGQPVASLAEVPGGVWTMTDAAEAWGIGAQPVAALLAVLNPAGVLEGAL